MSGSFAHSFVKTRQTVYVNLIMLASQGWGQAGDTYLYTRMTNQN